MKGRSFYIILCTLSVASAMVLYVLTRIELFTEFQYLFFGTLIFFIVLSILLYYVSKIAAVHKNKMLFIYVMVLAIVVKFIFCLVALFIYNRLYLPETNLYVLPFIGIYLVFTIFETYFMMKLGKLKPEPSES